jgi:hypothetical protein
VRDRNQTKRGFKVTLELGVFSKIVTEALKLQGDTRVVHVSDSAAYRGITLHCITKDERFPLIQEGCEYPNVILEMEAVKVAEGFTEVIVGVHPL